MQTKTMPVSHMPDDLNEWLKEYAKQKFYRGGAKSLLIVEILQDFKNKVDKK
jgi:hypothetical protein